MAPAVSDSTDTIVQLQVSKALRRGACLVVVACGDAVLMRSRHPFGLPQLERIRHLLAVGVGSYDNQEIDSEVPRVGGLLDPSSTNKMLTSHSGYYHAE